MISLAYIKEWKAYAPWPQSYQVEQDLIISRALVEIFSHPIVAKNLAFRGGTALYKLYLKPARYSEDIDLVQVNRGAIGGVIDALQENLNHWLGVPKRNFSEGRVTLIYKVQSEEGPLLKLKVEINSREHFTVLGFEKRKFAVNSKWFTGSADILTYQLEELLGTKLRGLYQRKKGRDLFDLWTALTNTNAKPEKVIECFLNYMEHEGNKVTRAEFEKNLYEKLYDARFIEDISPLLYAEGEWDLHKAGEVVMNQLVTLIPGEPWKREKTRKEQRIKK
ncbi:MAG: nucleotidyl transferase AbiEii/AbiGii toxin family protein [Candidatus Schekmanbacteria bacterium]|nr:nucleotidyl transferase AbiEii/AbiGii toxin family protein [Candidatus Schekmanbacteria bacterium]